MSIWKFIGQTLAISFIGFSLFSASFIVSLLIGTAAEHPILGSVSELVGYAQGIIACSFGISVANVLSSLSVRQHASRRNTYALRGRSYSVIR